MTAAAQAQTTTVDLTERLDNHWLASGFVGTNFAEDVDDPRFDLGGTVCGAAYSAASFTRTSLRVSTWKAATSVAAAQAVV